MGYIGKLLSIIPVILILLIGATISLSGSGLYVLGTDGNVPSGESTYVDNLVNWISDAAVYGSHHPSIVYSDPGATKDSIMDAASPPEDPAMVFFVGHGEFGAVALHRVYLMIDDSNNIVSDNSTYSATVTRRVHFVFLHSCFLGAEIGGFFTIPSIAGPIPYHYGMPQAWLHTTIISPNGYEKPDHTGYVFIVWKGPAPFLSADILGANDTMYRFIGNFFDKLFGYYTLPASSVNQALDYASHAVFGKYTRFDETPLYSGFSLDGMDTSMIVYGDGNYDNW